ncbi:DNA mismatch repair protein MutL [Sphaerulina musiva SO2202]|uniref:DNA mismatch repair protein PMS1 n=1 Tax=Sphaerulina musiva (strain SO2202) TaxID=692275 RepID=M3DBT2_SPHMS|nr:DNA mismatch repair protein MutL [Sphaerulina musiva SO2202]EMF15515.1 DNA mismatch repair protein MutL [Sphaerulina musiva SO2202]
MATIKAIEDRSVHQIQSGQVIVDLCSVCKELVENSLDAGATSIELRFKNQGLDAIEVQDNGKGIGPDDFESIALKHHTSKLSNYEDLTSLDTFGFRGEALSSLCALSKFHILTARAEDGAIGKKLDFEVSGKLKGTSVAAAQKGTTVYVEDIFHNLPVRRRELEKNIKREYTKVINLMYSYACISTGVRFSVSNTMPKSKKAPVFATKANATTKENITNVFGAKTALALAKLDLNLEMAPSMGLSTPGAKGWSTQATDRSMIVRIEGHVSKPIFGEGRQAPDRQMYFVNGRPCLLPQVAKAVNEVYKSFNVLQTPFVLANLIMDTNAYDVNVSPDKRSIMLHDQTALLETFKSALTEMFEQTDHTVPQSQLPSLPNRNIPAYQPLTIKRAELKTISSPQSTSEATSSDDVSDVQSGQPPTNELRTSSPSNLIHSWIGRNTESRKAPKQQHCASTKEKELSMKFMPAASSPTALGDDPNEQDENQAVTEPLEEQTPIPAVVTSSQKSTPGLVPNAFDRMRPKRTPFQTAEITVGDVTTTTTIGTSPPYKKRRTCKPGDSQKVANYVASPSLARSLRMTFAAPGSQLEVESSGVDPRPLTMDDRDGDDNVHAESPLRSSRALSSQPPASPDAPTSDPLDDLTYLASADEDDEDGEYMDADEKKMREDERVARMIQEAEEAAARPTELNLKRAMQALKNGGNRKGSTLQLATCVQTTSDKIRAQLDILASKLQSSTEQDEIDPTSERTIIEDELDSAEAESRLSLTVVKSDFARMQIVGQFNLGFILAIRPGKNLGEEDDLFIIDQHAADEKYNYERLRRTVTLQSQRLVRPKQLELTAIEEEVILSNRDALKANGFEIETTSDATESDEAVAPGSRCRLLTLPMSREKTFDLSDLEELLHLLSEEPPGSSDVPRPMKVQRMLAMRACRSSIMVGKTLTHAQMKKVINHMGEMEKPWNCPHGRPTMRHLAGLSAWTGWTEGDMIDDNQLDAADAQAGRKTNWKAWLESRTT